jgi:hypothetical protein
MTILSQAQKAVETYPAKITSVEFHKLLEENPSVFEHWDTPLEITEYIFCRNKAITHLSPHLTFSGTNESGHAAAFAFCPNLQNATGTFHGSVNFTASGVKKIENFIITQPDTTGALTVATGNYPRAANFQETGITHIENLEIEKPNVDGSYANFCMCPNLHTLEGWDLSKSLSIEPQKLEAEINRRNALKTFHKQSQPEELPFL